MNIAAVDFSFQQNEPLHMSREKFYDNIETRQNEILSATIVAVRFVFDKLSFSLQYCVQEPYEHVFSLV